MDTPNWQEILLSAKLSQLVYETDITLLANGVLALGLEYHGIFGNTECQIMASREPNGLQHFTIRGTQVETNFSGPELWDDISMEKVNYGGGALACKGVIVPLRELWFNEVGAVSDPEYPIRFEGHSLGGNRALLAPMMLPRSIKPSVIALAPPQGANRAFWDVAYSGRNPPIIVGRTFDFALGWDHFDTSTCHPCGIYKLFGPGIGQQWEYVPSWPSTSLSIADHDVDKYVADIEWLAINRQ